MNKEKILANVGEKASKHINNAKLKALIASNAVMCALPQIAMATNETATGTKKNAKALVKAAIGVVVDIFPLIGGFFVVSGGFKLVMAYRGDNPEAQTGAAKDIVIGAVLIAFKVFVWKALKGYI